MHTSNDNDQTSNPTTKLKRMLAAVPVAIVLGAAAPAAGSAQDLQPAATDCVIQGTGTPCTLATGAAASPAQDGALAWAQAQMGAAQWDGLCLQFVHDAYTHAGVDIAAQAGSTESAIAYWNSYSGTKNPPSATPPAGALVFWDATASNEYGHVAVSEGNGLAISTYERSYTTVHEMTIANRDAQGYTQLGWILPG